MDLNRIATFVRVVEAGSFTAAAASLALPKSSVSRSVSRLEEELGVRLLQRTTRKLSLTDAGREYWTRAREAVTGLDEANAAVSDMGKDPRGTVRITAPVDAGLAMLADIVARFVRRHPGIRIELALTARKVDLVEEGFDLALRAGKLEDSTLVARKIASSEAGLYASPAYLRRRGRPRSIAELASHDCVLFRAKGGKQTWHLTGPDGEESVEVTGPVEADDLSFVTRLLGTGAGIGLVPAMLCTHYCKARSLVRILPEHAYRGAGLYVVTPSSRHQPARVTIFRDFLVKELLALPW